jgi:hypothetical protein
MRFIFPGPTTWEIQMLRTILIDLTKLNIGDLLTQKKNNIKLLYPIQNMTLRNS